MGLVWDGSTIILSWGLFRHWFLASRVRYWYMQCGHYLNLLNWFFSNTLPLLNFSFSYIASLFPRIRTIAHNAFALISTMPFIANLQYYLPMMPIIKKNNGELSRNYLISNTNLRLVRFMQRGFIKYFINYNHSLRSNHHYNNASLPALCAHIHVADGFHGHGSKYWILNPYPPKVATVCVISCCMQTRVCWHA